MNESPFRDLVLQKAFDALTGNQRYLTMAVLGIGIPFLVYYVAAYYRLARQGYRVSWQKVILFVTTGSVSVYVWGFRSFFDAFWVMNFFHALQYFAIVFHTEKTNLARLFRVDRLAVSAGLVLLWIVALKRLPYGFWATQYANGIWTAGHRSNGRHHALSGTTTSSGPSRKNRSKPRAMAKTTNDCQKKRPGLNRPRRSRGCTYFQPRPGSCSSWV